MIVLLSFQLIAETQHHHYKTSQSKDCTACYVSAQSTGNSPVNGIEMPSTNQFTAYFITLYTHNSLYVPLNHYFKPLSQGPPQIQ